MGSIIAFAVGGFLIAGAIGALICLMTQRTSVGRPRHETPDHYPDSYFLPPMPSSQPDSGATPNVAAQPDPIAETGYESTEPAALDRQSIVEPRDSSSHRSTVLPDGIEPGPKDGDAAETNLAWDEILVVVDPDTDPKSFHIPAKGSAITIGSASDDDVRIEHQEILPHHVVLQSTGRSWLVAASQQSQGGAILSGLELSIAPHEIEDGEVDLVLAGLKIRILLGSFQ